MWWFSSCSYDYLLKCNKHPIIRRPPYITTREEFFWHYQIWHNMACQGNDYNLVLSDYANPTVYWAVISIYILGIFMNVVFIYISCKEAEKTKSQDNLLSLLCCVQLCNAIFMVVKTTFAFKNHRRYSTDNWCSLFGKYNCYAWIDAYRCISLPLFG